MDRIIYNVEWFSHRLQVDSITPKKKIFLVKLTYSLSNEIIVTMVRALFCLALSNKKTLARLEPKRSNPTYWNNGVDKFKRSGMVLDFKERNIVSVWYL
jgi:hypothetical protein